MTERIRWHDEDGSRDFAVTTGYTGTIGVPLFKIYEPDERGGGHAADWLLTCGLPAQDRTRYGESPDELKAEAERWLEEFILSLGASFPDEPGESAASQLSEARDVLARWDAGQGGVTVISREKVLADQVRALLAVYPAEPVPSQES